MIERPVSNVNDKKLNQRSGVAGRWTVKRDTAVHPSYSWHYPCLEKGLEGPCWAIMPCKWGLILNTFFMRLLCFMLPMIQTPNLETGNLSYAYLTS